MTFDPRPPDMRQITPSTGSESLDELLLGEIQRAVALCSIADQARNRTDFFVHLCNEFRSKPPQVFRGIEEVCSSFFAALRGREEANVMDAHVTEIIFYMFNKGVDPVLNAVDRFFSDMDKFIYGFSLDAETAHFIFDNALQIAREGFDEHQVRKALESYRD